MTTSARLRGPATAFVFAASVAACESSLDGLTGGNVTDAASAPRDQAAAPGTDGGASTCPAGAFCDDFENGLAPASWAIDNDDGRSSVAVEPGRPHEGTRALHVTINAAGESVGSVQHVVGVRSTGVVAVRGWFFLRNIGPSVSLVELRREGSTIGGVSLKVFGTSLAYDVSNTKGTNVASGTGTAIALGEWACLRFVIDLGTAGRIRILRGETTVLDAQTDTLADSGGWGAVAIGLPYVENASGAEAFVDDVVIADQLIDCE